MPPLTSLGQPAPGGSARGGGHWGSACEPIRHRMERIRQRRGLSLKNLARLLLAAVVVCRTAPSAYAATHFEVLNAVKQQWNSLPGVDASADNQALLDFVTSIPEFSSVGLDTRCSCVWAVFSDDGSLVLLANNSKLPGPPSPAVVTKTSSHPGASARNNQPPSPLAELAPAAASPIELPKGQFAVLMNVRGPDMPNPVPDLRAWLTAQSYVDPSPLCNDASVQCLRQGPVGPDEAVYYLATYGGLVERVAGGPKDYVLATSTMLTAATENDPLIQADLAARRLAYGPHEHYWNPVTQKWEVETFYWINADFIRYYWAGKQFAPDSLVFIDACDSDLAADLKQAMFDRNASVFAGWDEKVSVTQGPSVAEFFFDRLLGANKVVPEADGFQQRAFDYGAAGADADYHGMNDFPAFLRFTANPAQTQTSFGLLAPSIAIARPIDVGNPVYPGGTLVLVGSFGSDPRPDPDSGVTVGGIDCPVQTNGWQPNQITCDLPSGAAGDVVVTVCRHASNKARLTKWTAESELGSVGYLIKGDDTLQASITYYGNFRAEVRKFRPAIHLPPVVPSLVNTFIPDESAAHYTCSGRAVSTQPGVTITITWTGEGLVPAARNEPIPANSFEMKVDGPDPLMLTISHGSDVTCGWTITEISDDGTEFTFSGTAPLPGLLVNLGTMPVEPADPSIPGNVTMFLGCGSLPTFGPTQCSVGSNRMVATYPPDPSSAR